MPVKKATKAAAPAKKAAARAKAKPAGKGDAFGCELCGLVVTIDEDCGCIEEHAIICCGEPMKQKKAAKVKAKK